MKKYLVTITDIIEVSAESEDEASDIVNEQTGPYALIQEIKEEYGLISHF